MFWDFKYVKNFLGVSVSDGQLWEEWVQHASSFLHYSAPSQTGPSQPPSIRLPLSDAFVFGASNDVAVNNYHEEQPPAASIQISESEGLGSSSTSDYHGAFRNIGPHPQCLPPVTAAAFLNASQSLPSISTSTLQTLPHKAVQKDYSPTATPKFMLPTPAVPPPVVFRDAKYPPKGPPMKLLELDST